MRVVSRERATRQPSGSVGSLGMPTQDSTERLPSVDRFGWWLVLICALAFILRLAVVYQGRNSAAERRRLCLQHPSQSQRSGTMVCLYIFKWQVTGRSPSAGLDAVAHGLGMAGPTQLALATNSRFGRRHAHRSDGRTGRTPDRGRTGRVDRGRDRCAVPRFLGLRTSDPVRDAAAARNRCHDSAGIPVPDTPFSATCSGPWHCVRAAGADEVRRNLGSRRGGCTPHSGRETDQVASAHRLAGAGHSLCDRCRDSLDHIQLGPISASGSALEQLRVSRRGRQLRHYLLRALHRHILGGLRISGAFGGSVCTKLSGASPRFDLSSSSHRPATRCDARSGRSDLRLLGPLSTGASGRRMGGRQHRNPWCLLCPHCDLDESIGAVRILAPHHPGGRRHHCAATPADPRLPAPRLFRHRGVNRCDDVRRAEISCRRRGPSRLAGSRGHRRRHFVQAMGSFAQRRQSGWTCVRSRLDNE